MAIAYTPGLKVSAATWLYRERRLPLLGEVLASVGDRVEAGTVVARTFLPGAVTPLNVANKLGIDARDLKSCMIKKEGDPVAQDEEIAVTKGLFGLFKQRVTSPRAGHIQIVSDTTGQVMIQEPHLPVEIDAYVDGVVSQVLPREGVVVRTHGTLVQGIFGVGGEVTGILAMETDDPDALMEPARIRPEHAGKILVGGSLVTREVLEVAIRHEVSAIVVGGIDDADLRAWMGHDLGVAVTGSEELGLTLIITEGFGRIRMARRTFDLLSARVGSKTSVSGATQIRAGVIRPEIVIPLPSEQWPTEEQSSSTLESLGMEVGSPVRIIREPSFGSLARVVALPVELAAVPTEARVRVVEVELDDGRRMTLPRANVEVIET